MELPFGGSAIPFEEVLGTGPAPKDPWSATASFDPIGMTCVDVGIWHLKDGDHQLPAQSDRRGRMGVKLLVSWLTLTAEPAGVSFTQAELDQIFEFH